MTAAEPVSEPRRMLGLFLVLLATFTVVSSIYFEAQARESRSCIERKIGELSAAVEARGELATRSNMATQTVIMGVAAAQAMKSESAGDAAFTTTLKTYAVTVADIEADREATPLPDFPPGECAS